MSADTSTFFLGWILPLAVTAATRSRRPVVSNRTSWPRSRRAAAPGGQVRRPGRRGAVGVVSRDRLKRRLERQVPRTDVGLHLQSTCPPRLLQTLLLGLRLTLPKRLWDNSQQRDR